MYQAVMSSWGSKQRAGKGSREAEGWAQEADTLELGGAHQLCGPGQVPHLLRPPPPIPVKWAQAQGSRCTSHTMGAGLQEERKISPGGSSLPQLTRLRRGARGPGCCLGDKAPDPGDFRQCRAGWD